MFLIDVMYYSNELSEYAAFIINDSKQLKKHAAWAQDKCMMVKVRKMLNLLFLK